MKHSRYYLLAALAVFFVATADSYTVSAPSGISTIANHLNNGGNTLGVLFPDVPSGTIISKWDCPTQDYVHYTNTVSVWVPSGGTLSPGEGAFINLPSAHTLHFFGTPVLYREVPPSSYCGCGELSLMSSQVTNNGTYEVITGMAPAEGAQVLRWNGGGYTTYIFTFGEWRLQQTYVPAIPVLDVGESAWFLVPCPEVFCISMTCPTNKTVECGTGWDFDPPTDIEINCCTNFYDLDSTTETNSGPCPWVITRTWLVSDMCTNTATCSQTVTVEDTTPPEIFCPQDIVVQSCSNEAVYYTVTTEDLCCSNVTVECTPPSGSFFPLGTSVVNCVATDCCSNSASCDFEVIVECSCVCAPTNMALWLPLDETSGTVAANLVSEGNNGAWVGSPAVNVGAYVSNSLCFNGVDQYVSVPDYLEINPGIGDFSIDAWIKRDPASGSTTRMIVNKRGGSPTRGYALFASTGHLGFQLVDGTGYSNYGNSTNTLAIDDQWHHVAVTINRSSTNGGQYYIDGVLKATFDPTDRPGSLHNTNDFQVGASFTGNNSPWMGCIDEVEFFTRALSAAEVESIFNAGPAGKCKECFDDCEEPVIYSTASDFTDNGVLMNLVYTNGALRFPSHTQPFPYVYMACSGRGTIVKIDINAIDDSNGNFDAVLGEYKTAPTSDNTDPSPSRTTVDLLGNVWVGNRAPVIVGSKLYGTVTRIALIIGGERVKANGEKDPDGQYLKPPFLYNSGAVDRNNDGLIKTSYGLGNILPWNGPEPGNGTVSDLEADECIINYTVVSTINQGIKTVAVDWDNNVWVGAVPGWYEKINGWDGRPVGSPFIGAGFAGGYGGVIDGNNVLWSASKGIGLLRVDLGTLGADYQFEGSNLGLAHGDYGLAVDPCGGNIWYSSHLQNSVSKWSPPGIWQNTYEAQNPIYFSAGLLSVQGVAVDESGNVWIAHALGNISVGRISSTTGQPVGKGYITLNGNRGPTGVAVDANGNVWVSCESTSKAVRIDPSVVGVDDEPGKVDLEVDLNAAGGLPAEPYNYSDMTGILSVGVTHPSGFWNFVHESCPGTEWGTVSWVACTGTVVKVQVRAADKVLDLAAKPWNPVENGQSFCSDSSWSGQVKGQYLEVRVTLERGTTNACESSTACLESLSIKCCRSSGLVMDWPYYGGISVTNPIPFTTNMPVAVTWDGQPLTFDWFTNGVLAQTDVIYGDGTYTNTTVDFIKTYPHGSNAVELVVTGVDFDPINLDTYVVVGDIEPPEWEGPPAYSEVAYSATMPDLVSNLTSNDLCDDWTSFDDILKFQDIPPGTVLTQRLQMVELTATDQAGNTSTNYVPFALEPVLTITSPDSYSAFSTSTGMPVVVQIASNITDVVEVRYYLSGNLVDVAFISPFDTTVTNAVAGGYRLWAEAVSSGGLTSVSYPKSVSFFTSEEPARVEIYYDSGTLTLSWPAGWSLENAPYVTGTWTDVEGSISPYPIATTNMQMFFRLEQ